MKRVAIPINNGKLSEYFGQCSHYRIFEIENGSVHEKRYGLPDIKNIVELPEWVSGKGITDIITHKIDRQIIMLFNKYKINLFVGIEIGTPEQLIHEFLNEQIKSDYRIISEIIDNK